MTVESTESRQRYIGDSVTKRFGFGFPFLEDSDLQVIVRSGGVETLLVNQGQYLIERAAGPGGNVVLQNPLTGTEAIAIVRNPAPLQKIDLSENDRFFLETLERGFDRNIMIAQRHADLLGRALLLAETDVDGSGAFRAKNNRIAGLSPGVNASDAVTVAQLASVAGGDVLVTPGTIAAVTALVIEDPTLLALFGPMNDQIGSLTTLVTNLQNAVDLLAQVDGDENNLIALIQAEEDAREEGDTAIATKLALLGAASLDGLSFVIDTAKAKISSTESLAQRLSGIATRFDSNESAILNEATARSNQYGSLAAQIATLQSSSGGGTATIQEIVASINGIQAKYAVKIDNNGYISGFGLLSEPNNGAVVSAFVVLADQFRIVNPGAPTVAPFQVIGGVTYIRDVVVRNASIENLTITKLTAGTLNQDMNLGTGRIVQSAGGFMTVRGVGFGTTAQFLEWFGPVMAIDQCSEANARSYTKVNGDQYFGGAISAGVLKSAGQTTSTSGAASVTVGPFGSNGNPISVVLSYAFYALGNVTGSGTQNTDTPINATVQLYRTIGAGSETLVDTLNIGGNCHHGPASSESGGPLTVTWTESMSGSKTYTDSAGGASDRTYRAVISVRSLHHVFSSGTQNLSVVCTESP